LIKNNDLLK